MTDFFAPHVERLEDRRLLAAVASMTPAPGSYLNAVPEELQVTFDEAVDPATVTGETFSVERSGNDGTFGDGNEVTVPGNVVVASDRMSATFAIDGGAMTEVAGIGGRPFDVQVVGNLAYLANRTGLEILDVSDSSAPILVAGCGSPGQAYGVDVVGTFAYLADGPSGLSVIDISNPADPRLVGRVDTPDFSRNVTVVGGYAYVADRHSGLRIVDVADPASPHEVGHFDTPSYAESVAVAGTVAYVADGEGGLRVISVSDPSNPMESGSFEPGGYVRDVAVSGGYAYVPNGGGLRVIDVSDPANPSEVAFVDPPHGFYNVEISGTNCFLATNGGLYVVDVSDPTHPVELDVRPQPDRQYRALDLSGTNAYLVDVFDGLEILDVVVPTQPVHAAWYNTINDLASVDKSGNYAYAAADPNFYVFDVSDPHNPQHVGSADTFSQAVSVAVSGDYAYLATVLYGLRVHDVTDPTDPRQVYVLDTPGTAWDVALSGTLACVADGDFGLRVIDISQPDRPRELGSVDTPGTAWAVALNGAYAYVADGDHGMRIINVSAPANPTEVGFVDMPSYAKDISVVGSYAYVADYNGGLRIVNVGNPTNPFEVAVYDTPGIASHVFVSNGTAYVTDSVAGVLAIDVIQPTNPRRIAQYDSPGTAGGLHVSGSYGYLADGPTGLRVIEVSRWASPPHDRYRVTLSGTEGGSGAITDLARDPLDGEGDYRFPLPVGDFPTGDGTPGGDAVLEFEFVPTGPRVTSMTPQPGSLESAAPAEITVTFDETVNPATVTSDTFHLVRSGGDGTFDDGNEVVVPGTVVTAGDGLSATLQIAVNPLPADSYRVTLDGTDDADGAIFDLPGHPLDGDGDFVFPLPVVDFPTGDGVPGGDAELEFVIIDLDGPRVVSMNPSPGVFLHDAPAEIAFTFDEVVDPNSVTEDTVSVVRSGGDGTFDDGNEVFVAGDIRTASDGLSVTYEFGSGSPGELGGLGGAPQDVVVAGDFAYVADLRGGLHLIDISDPLHLTSVGKIDTPGYARQVSVAGNHAFVADDDGGLRIVDISKEFVDDVYRLTLDGTDGTGGQSAPGQATSSMAKETTSSRCPSIVSPRAMAPRAATPCSNFQSTRPAREWSPFRRIRAAA